MTADASAQQDREGLFVADFHPQLGEYLADGTPPATTPAPGELVSRRGSMSTRKGPDPRTRSRST